MPPLAGSHWKGEVTLPKVEPKITTQKLQKAREQQQVLKELLGHIPAGNPFYLGFFYTSNSIAFNATIKETNALSAVDLAALKQAGEYTTYSLLEFT